MRREPLDGRRHDVGHDPRALAAAEHQQPQRTAGLGRRIGSGRRGDHRPADRIAGAHRLGGERRRAVEHAIEAGGDGVHPLGQQPVGASHHGVLLVDERGNSAQRRRQHRRHGRIAAEADDGGGRDAPEQPQRLDRSDAHERAAARERDRIARAHGLARDHVDLPRRKTAAVALGARVGGEIDGDVAARQHVRQRLRREQVSAGSAGRDEHERRAALVGHAALPAPANAPGLARNSARGRSRVKASSMPMP